MSIGPLKYQDFIIANSQISSSRKFWKDPAPLDTFVAASRRPLRTGLRVSVAPVLTSPPRLPHPAHSADPAKLARGAFWNTPSRGSMQFREFRKPELPAHAACGRRRSYEADAFGRLRTGEAAIGPVPPTPCTKSLKLKAGVGPVRSLTDRQTNTAHLLLPAPSPSHLQTGQRIEHRIKIHRHVWLPGCSPGASVGLNP